MLRKTLFTAVMACAIMIAQSPFAMASAGGGEKPKEGEVTGPVYVELDPLLLPIIDDQGISQQVSLIVKLELKDPAKSEEIKAIMPRIVDAFVQEMYGTLSTNTSFMSNGVLRLDLVKARLKETVGKVVEHGEISDVLLQVVQQHRV